MLKKLLFFFKEKSRAADFDFEGSILPTSVLELDNNNIIKTLYISNMSTDRKQLLKYFVALIHLLKFGHKL